MNTNTLVLPTDAANQLGFLSHQLASGAVKSKLMSRKEFGEANNLKGAELKRKHYDYLKSNGVKLGAVVAGGLAGGGIIPQAVTFNADTGKGSILFVTAEKFGSAPAEKSRGPAKLSDEALIDELLRRKLNLAPIVAKLNA